MSKKKLCYILPVYDIDTTSHYFHIYELLEDLCKIVDIYLIIEQAKSKPAFKNIEKIYVQRFRQIPAKFIERFLILTYVRLIGYDKFYVHYSELSAIIASIITKILGGETHYWNCGLIKNYMARWALNIKAIKTKIFHDYMFLLTLMMVDYLVTGTPSMADYYSTSFGINRKRIKVVPNWVNFKRFNPKKYDNRQLREKFGIIKGFKVVLFIHRLSERKGAHHIAEIARYTIEEIPNVVFMIVGDGPYRHRLEQSLSENGLTRFVQLLGGVPNREIVRYFAIGDVFILPSEEEGFPRVLLECMAMGVPFVAMNSGGVKDVLTQKQKCFMVERGDIRNFVEALVKLLRDSVTRQELIEEGFHQVQEYRKEKVVKAFMEQIVSTNFNPIIAEKT